tara:strand:+ start:464 stop:724 length:261 start_codon:yes stop_codon:yes gene_type:complete
MKISSLTSGGELLVIGHSTRLLDAADNKYMIYHMANLKVELKTGVCSSKPEISECGNSDSMESGNELRVTNQADIPFGKNFNFGIL